MGFQSEFFTKENQKSKKVACHDQINSNENVKI